MSMWFEIDTRRLAGLWGLAVVPMGLVPINEGDAIVSGDEQRTAQRREHPPGYLVVGSPE